MKTFTLKGESRTEFGKKANKALRVQELVPCSLYGGKRETNINFTVSIADLRHLIYTPHVYIVELNVAGEVFQAILKDIQFHPVSDEILHIDFVEIYNDIPVVMEIPVKLEGLAQGVKEGGKLNLEMRYLKMKGDYKNFPDNLTINVSELGLGKTIQVQELAFDNLQIMNSTQAVVVAVKLTRAARGAAAAAAGK